MSEEDPRQQCSICQKFYPERTMMYCTKCCAYFCRKHAHDENSEIHDANVIGYGKNASTVAQTGWQKYALRYPDGRVDKARGHAFRRRMHRAHPD